MVFLSLAGCSFLSSDWLRVCFLPRRCSCVSCRLLIEAGRSREQPQVFAAPPMFLLSVAGCAHVNSEWGRGGGGGGGGEGGFTNDSHLHHPALRQSNIPFSLLLLRLLGRRENKEKEEGGGITTLSVLLSFKDPSTSKYPGTRRSFHRVKDVVMSEKRNHKAGI